MPYRQCTCSLRGITRINRLLLLTAFRNLSSLESFFTERSSRLTRSAKWKKFKIIPLQTTILLGTIQSRRLLPRPSHGYKVTRIFSGQVFYRNLLVAEYPAQWEYERCESNTPQRFYKNRPITAWVLSQILLC